MTILEVLNLHFAGKTLDLFESIENANCLYFKPLFHIPSEPVTLTCTEVFFVPAECDDYEILASEYFNLVFEDGRSIIIDYTLTNF
jgi:hypothetical protein